MSADTLTQALTWALFVAITVVAIWRSARRPLRVNVDLALLFGAIALIVIASLASALKGTQPGPLLIAVVSGLLMALPYLQLRIVDDFTVVPTWLKRAAEAGGVILVILLFVGGAPTARWLLLVYVAYFVALEAYNATSFVRAARR